MAKQVKKSKSPKLKKSNASEGSLKSEKRKTSKGRSSFISSKLSRKTRVSNDLTDSKKKDEIRNSIVNDDLWNCTVVILACPPTNGDLPRQLEELPNTTVISSKTLGQTTMNKNKSPRSRASSGTKATKATKKTSNKTKTLKSKTSKNVGDEEKSKTNLEEEKLNLINTCTLIKQQILSLRNSDLGLDKSRKKSDKPKGKTKEINKKRDHTVGQNAVSSSEETDLKISHRYVVLWGFYSLVLPEIMKNMLVPVKALITIRFLNLPRRESNPSNIKIQSNIRPKHKSLSIEKSDNYNLFLNNVTKYRHDLEYLEKNSDLLFLNYNIADFEADGSTINWIENMNKILNLIRHSWNEFERFKDSQNMIDIPCNEALNVEGAIIYNTMISMVPMECVSIPIIINCMLDQVIHWVDNEEGNSSESVIISDHTSFSNENCLNANKYSCNSFNTYPHITMHKPMINVSPILVNAADDSKYKTFHIKLPEFDFDMINSSFSCSSLVCKLWDLFPKLSSSKIKWDKFNFDQLKQFLSGYVNNDNLFTIHFHHFRMILFLLKLGKIYSESENTAETDLNSLSSQGKSVYLQSVEDKYSIYFVGRIVGNIIQQVPKLSIQLKEMLLSKFESIGSSYDQEDGDGDQPHAVQKSKLLEKLLRKQEKFEKLKSFVVHSDLLGIYNDFMLLEEEQYIVDAIKSFQYIEELDRGVLCQNLNSALQHFENVNFLYSPITDSILLWFNNNVNMNEIKNTYNIESHLETQIGFRDFYKYKLGGKTNLTEAVLRYDSSLNEVQTSNRTSILMDLKQPIPVYNLGSLHLQVFESHSNFFSPDGSYVKVKRVNYFEKLKSSVTVSIVKNDTLLTYECDPENRKKHIMLRMSLCNTVEIGCSLSWDQHNTSDEDNFSVETNQFNIDIILNISLPSGLFIEIVRSDSILGPFYIRQRYLSKGPTCSNIWDENFRCYLRNGTIVIFYKDDTVDILYSNGTKVNCASFELINKYSEVAIIMDDEKKVKSEKNIDTSKSTNISKSNRELKAKSKKGGSNKAVKKSTSKSPKKSLIADKPQELEVNGAEKITQQSLNVSKHSVISWNGSSTEYESGVLKGSNDLLTLRMAFDKINQELYLQRSDKLTLLYTLHDLTVTFPDGSRITSIMEDKKTLAVFNELDIVAVEDEKSCSVSKNPSSESCSAEGSYLNIGSTGDKDECFVFVELSHFSEHKNYASVNFDNLMNEVDLLLPGGVGVKLDAHGLFSISGMDGEQISLTNHSLAFEAEVLESSLNRSKTFLYFENIDSTPTIQCQTEDSFGNLFSVDEFGRTNVLQVHWDINRSDYLIFPRYPKNFERLFVFNRDLTGYEMIHTMQYNKLLSDKKTKIVKNGVKSDFGELFTLFAQTPIFKNVSQEYLLNYENNLPTLIRRKDLIKSSRMPDQIWFIPELSTVTESPDNDMTISKLEIPEAFVIRKLFKIKEDGEKLLTSFYDALKRYVASGEELYSRYLLAYPKDNRSYDIYEQGELQREEMFGSGSYYLSDNIKIPEVDNRSLENEEIRVKFC